MSVQNIGGNGDAIIQVRGLTKQYDEKTRVLEGIGLDISRGDWTVIMGPSGSGKTTLLNILSGLDRPTSGSVALDGVDIAALNQSQLAGFRRENVGLVFQQYHLVPYLTALENVMLAQYFHSVPDEAEARAALEKVGLGHRLDHRPAHLSGGEQQRVCIARALINDPKIIFADEPTGNLDGANSALILDLFRQVRSDGRTIVMVTHDPSVAALGDRVVRVRDGRLVSEKETKWLATEGSKPLVSKESLVPAQSRAG